MILSFSWALLQSSKHNGVSRADPRPPLSYGCRRADTHQWRRRSPGTGGCSIWLSQCALCLNCSEWLLCFLARRSTTAMPAVKSGIESAGVVRGGQATSSQKLFLRRIPACRRLLSLQRWRSSIYRGAFNWKTEILQWLDCGRKPLCPWMDSLLQLFGVWCKLGLDCIPRLQTSFDSDSLSHE